MKQRSIEGQPPGPDWDDYYHTIKSLRYFAGLGECWPLRHRYTHDFLTIPVLGTDLAGSESLEEFAYLFVGNPVEQFIWG